MKRLLALALVAVVVASGCISSGGCGTLTPHNSSDFLSETPTSPESGGEGLGKGPVVQGMNAFAFELYRELSQQGENIFFSPCSIEVALAMAYEGARRATREEMGQVLHLPEDNETRRAGFRELVTSLNSQDTPYIIATANALWVQRGYPIKDNYLDTVRKYYLGEVRELDFKGNPRGAEKTINEWVEEKTGGRIKNLVSGLTPSTRLVITNAGLFQGKLVKEVQSMEHGQRELHNCLWRKNSGAHDAPDGQVQLHREQGASGP